MRSTERRRKRKVPCWKPWKRRQVTADGDTYALPTPFFVVATRNPTEQIGTFPLPESQLDRFLMQISLGYPLPSEERLLLANGDRRDLVDGLDPVLSVEALIKLQAAVSDVHVADAALDYVQALVAHTRESGQFNAGLSPRGALALVRASQSWAMMAGHRGVHPEDVQAVFPSVVQHRLDPTQDSELDAPEASANRFWRPFRSPDPKLRGQLSVCEPKRYSAQRLTELDSGLPRGRSDARDGIPPISCCGGSGSTSCRAASASYSDSWSSPWCWAR